MKLIFALGNIGDEYTGTRHNVAWSVVDSLADSWQRKPKLYSLIAEKLLDDEKILLVKPTTFYNEAGKSLHAVMAFYKLKPSDVLVVHDDLALPFGTIRTRVGGSGGGNNGIKSINTHGGDLTSRLRIGIANNRQGHINDADYVLSKFSSDEVRDFQPTLKAATTIINDFCKDTFQATTDTQSPVMHK